MNAYRFVFLPVWFQLITCTAFAAGDSPPKPPPIGVRYPFLGSGDSFTLSQSDILKKLHAYKGTKAIICYELVKDPNSTYYLSPIAKTGAIPTQCWDREDSDDGSALVTNQKIWVAIYVAPASASLAAAISSITLSVTSASASPIQITPIRPSAGAQLPQVRSTEAVYYFPWPYRLQSDTIPTVTVSAYAEGAGSGASPIDIGDEQLSQVHQLSRFNISTAVIFSTVRTSTFGYSTGSPATMTTSAVAPSPMVTGHSSIIDPVIFLTYYPVPFDAERPFHWSDMLKPGISLGFSTSNPTSNFYFGFMSEFPGIRNLELVYGVTAAKVSYLPGNVLQPVAAAAPTTIPTPTTASKFVVGGYAGLSFNVSGFLTGLFGKGS